MANCKHCGNPFEAKRTDALYCGDTCRQAAKRVTDNLSQINPVTDNLDGIGPKIQHFNPVIPSPKRGKDIQTFEDLPPDVQINIEMMSRAKEKAETNTYEAEKTIRTAIAINYQHIFPDRFNEYGRELPKTDVFRRNGFEIGQNQENAFETVGSTMEPNNKEDI